MGLFSYAKAQDYVVPVETWDYEEINGSNYHGYAFHEGWDVDFTIENQDGRYTKSVSLTSTATISTRRATARWWTSTYANMSANM